MIWWYTVVMNWGLDWMALCISIITNWWTWFLIQMIRRPFVVISILFKINPNDRWVTYVIFYVWSIFVNNSDQKLISFTALKTFLFVSQLIGLLFLTQANRLQRIFCFKPKYKHNVVTHKLNNYAILHLLFAPQITFFVSTQTV